MTHSPIDVAVNPNNQAQRYILWTNGRIDNKGGAPAIVGPGWYDRLDTVAMALHITDWVAGKGYVLDWQGGFNPVGGAPNLMTEEVQYPLPSVPGVEYQTFRCYVDWAWNPNGSGQGYVLDLWGQLYAFGGATAPPRTGPRFDYPAMRRLKVQWTPNLWAISMGSEGGLYGDFGLNLPANLGNPFWPDEDMARDFAITDWGTAPLVKGYTLDSHGATHPFGGAPVGGAPGGVWMKADVARTLRVLSSPNPTRMWQVWSGGQEFEYLFSTPPTVLAGGGTSEVQRVTITGAPTGGTFTLTYSGQTTAAIARNATAATVKTALEALSNIGVNDVSVTGGPGPGTPWTVTFAGALATTNVAQMTATSSLTGGTAPAVTVSTLTGGVAASPPSTVTTTTRPSLPWSYRDPQADQQQAWQLLLFTQAFVDSHTMTNPLVWVSSALVAQEGNQRTLRGVTPPIDLANGSYRYYVRAQDTAGQWSAWSNRGWTQAVSQPATPTGLTATPNSTTVSTALSVSATVSVNADFIRFDYSDDAGATWLPVLGADAVPLATTTTATDRDAPMGKARSYRATAYAVTPRVSSNASSTATATLARTTYTLRAVSNTALGGPILVQDPIEWSRTSKAGVFEGIGSIYPTIVSDGAPKGRRTTLKVFVRDAASWALIEGLATADTTLVYRDPLGQVIYCRLVGDWGRALLKGAPGMHDGIVSLPLVEVAPPSVS